MRIPLVLAMLVAAVVAGCSGPAPEGTTATDFDDLELSAGTGRGLIRGVVVDSSIRPLANVTVQLGDGPNVTSDGEGRFGFSDVEPGIHFLKASKPGYGASQASVEVVADVAEPRAVTVLLERIPGTDPLVVAMQWTGFMQCSFTVGGAFGTGCLIGDFTDDDSRRYDAIEGEPAFLQSEVLWTATQALGTGFCMRQYASDDIGGEVLVEDQCGESPLVQQVDGARLNETGVGTEHGLERLVWVDGVGAHQGPGVALNQRFDVYTHLFYNLVPDPAWRFATDGPYPL